MASHPSPIPLAAANPRTPVVIVCGSPGADASTGAGFSSPSLLCAQFRSGALAGAGLISGSAIAVAAAVGARVQRVFAVSKMIGVAGLHEPNVDRGAERDAPEFEAPGA